MLTVFGVSIVLYFYELVMGVMVASPQSTHRLYIPDVTSLGCFPHYEQTDTRLQNK
jgi:hypothetical protein